MSAPAESTMSGGNAADNSRLGQPSDAVAMKTMPHSSDDASPDAAATAAVSAVSASTAQPPNVADAAPETVGSEPSSTVQPAASDKPEASGAASPAPVDDKDSGAAPPPPIKDRSDSGLAIGPAQDDINVIAPSGSDDPVCNITLLLTTGSRHPYKIDGKYLSRRNVAIPEQTEAGQPDPFSISIYTLKELILREWRSDWEAKPASPSSIRLIHFGKLLDDKEPLRSMSAIADPAHPRQPPTC
jgi:hypothetical protein